MLERRSPRLALWIACALLLLATGCSTQRTLIIESDPAGATAWINGELQAKPTPLRVPFDYPGTFYVRLEKEGYQSVQEEIVVPVGLEGTPVIDLAFETTVRERDHRHVVKMEPIPPEPGEAEVQSALGRARAFRERAEREAKEPGTPGRIAK